MRNDITAWLKFLRTNVGFDGWRFDFVKGYGDNPVRFLPELPMRILLLKMLLRVDLPSPGILVITLRYSIVLCLSGQSFIVVDTLDPYSVGLLRPDQ